jgi:glycosyltransferase involved in cell wall biosynthesis
MPSVDIALPFYGDVGYLKLAVESVLNQTDQDWRLLVSDDGYPDPHVSQWFKSLDDQRIIYSRNEFNLGANGNFRKCLEMVSADYLVVMGADDVMHSNYLSVMRNHIKLNQGISIVQPQVRVIDSKGVPINPVADRIKNRIRPSAGIHNGEKTCARLMTGNWLYFPSIMWRASDVKTIGFREDLNVAQDLGLAIDVLKAGKSMLVVNETLFDYRRHSGGDSITRALSGDRFIEERAFFEILEMEFHNLDWKKAKRAAKVHISSRLYAGQLLPSAIMKGKNPYQLVKHILA